MGGLGVKVQHFLLVVLTTLTLPRERDSVRLRHAVYVVCLSEKCR